MKNKYQIFLSKNDVWKEIIRKKISFSIINI